ncbi:PepSY-associated TM helix domain-containing protein [Parasphingorhabdus sp. JC815]|uniref:PepSY-associated TM helix domain-containing protein n=1 Tax=Parasphingorhabdus sp. JC815 TaxID=3232140 RepID=UPI0034593DFF
MQRRIGLKLWHCWFGILVGGWLMLLAVTGVAIAWYDELDIALNPDLRLTEISDHASISLDVVLDNAEAALPGFSANNIMLAPANGKTHWLLGRQSLPDGASLPMQVFADPATGTITGWRVSGGLHLDRQHFPDLLYGLHTELLAGETGATFIGIIGLLWLLDHLLAVPLAFPKLQKWPAAFQLAGKKGSLRRLFDWHRAMGMWLWLATFTITLTGVTLAFPNASRDLIRQVSPVSERLHESMPEAEIDEVTVGLNDAIARAGPGQVHSVRILPSVGQYAVRTYDQRDPDNQGRMWTYVDMADGSITGQRHDNGETGGDLFFAWQYPLHSGHAAGLGGRLSVTLVGLATIWLCISGLRLVWRRRNSRAHVKNATAFPA